MLDESTNATNWSKKYVAIDSLYRGTDNRNRLIYSDWRLSWAVSHIGHCCFNSNRWHIFGEDPGACGFITITIAFSRNERPIRTNRTWGHMSDETQSGASYSCYVSYLEIYNSSGYDLLVKDHGNNATATVDERLHKVTMLEVGQIQLLS